jgi:predicted HTH transcriptional regulator
MSTIVKTAVSFTTFGYEIIEDTGNKLSEFGRNSLEILKIIMDEPESSARKIAAKIKITDRTVEKSISKLKAAGIIERADLKKTGYWQIL